MMLFSPTLQVKRLQICRDSNAVYDENFHSGINVIRGENSSGKSTIISALFYSLGGDLTRWSDAAHLCTHVNVEVSLNGQSAVLSREISSKSSRPMDIFGGTLEMAASAPRSEWLRFPYARAGEKESFSQRIFSLLDVPQVANEQYGNITVHQLLRLMYSDQLSPIEELFRAEGFDSVTTRDTVGRLLCGAFDAELYSNEIRLRDLGREFDRKSAELRSLLSVLGRAEQSLTMDWLNAERSALQVRRADLIGQLERLQRESMAGSASGLSLDAQNTLYDQLKALQKALADQEVERNQLTLEIADSARFIRGLEVKQAALGDAAIAADAVGDVRYSHCPCCQAEVKPKAEGVCHLCSEVTDGQKAQDRIVAIRNDLTIQIRQSIQIQKEREEQLTLIERTVSEIRNKWASTAVEFNRIKESPVDEDQSALGKINREVGYVDKALEDLVLKERLVGEVEQLRADKEELNHSITALTSRNEILRAEQISRLADAYEAISDETKWFIDHDLKREEAFESVRRVDFDFGKNHIRVDGQEYFSASSRVILKNSFMAGFLFASMNKSYMNHFRLMIMDTIEDKGMEPVRSHNYQNLLRERSESSTVEHQIIFATSMISPELDEDRFTVGHFATREHPTLDIGRLS